MYTFYVLAFGAVGGGIVGFLLGIINVTGTYERAGLVSAQPPMRGKAVLPVVRGEAHDRQQPTFYNIRIGDTK